MKRLSKAVEVGNLVNLKYLGPRTNGNCYFRNKPYIENENFPFFMISLYQDSLRLLLINRSRSLSLIAQNWQDDTSLPGTQIPLEQASPQYISREPTRLAIVQRAFPAPTAAAILVGWVGGDDTVTGAAGVVGVIFLLPA